MTRTARISADLAAGPDLLLRCPWANSTDDYRAYHDEEWGQPIRDEHALFERLCLESFQSGLSWLTILRKRPAFRAAFAGFDPQQVASFDSSDVDRLLTDAAIVRHRGKIEATVANARALLAVWEDDGPGWLVHALTEAAGSEWSRRPGRMADVPSSTPGSTALARDLRRRGFRFLGPTTLYAALQATGFVDDHLEGCFAAAPGPTPR